MEYYYKEDFKIVEIEGKEYQLFNELNFRGQIPNGQQRPYLRRNTKINIFRDVRNNLPEVYLTLLEQNWYQAYKPEVENIPDVIIPDVVKNALTELNKASDERKSEIVETQGDDIAKAIGEATRKQGEMFTGALNQLVETLGDMNSKIGAMNTNTKLEEALIEGIVSKGKELAVGELQQEIKNNLDAFIKDTYGVLPTKINITNKEVEYDKTGLFHKEFEKVLKLVNMKLPVMLTGGAGSGKNFMLEQVADALNMSFYYTSTITQEYKLTGFIDGGGKYHETEFFKAFTQGGIFMLDEIDASIPECLVILNGAIANGYFDFPTGREIAHEDFRVVCAGNTVGLGADMVYTGRNVLDGATLDRFVLVEIDYDPRIEENLCQDEELRKFLYDVRKSVKSNKINHIIGMRCFKYSYELLVNGFEKEFIIKSVVLKGLQKDDINVLKSGLNSSNSWYNYIR